MESVFTGSGKGAKDQVLVGDRRLPMVLARTLALGFTLWAKLL